MPDPDYIMGMAEDDDCMSIYDIDTAHDPHGHFAGQTIGSTNHSTMQRITKLINKGKTCARCSKTGLHWKETNEGWRLAEPSGFIHVCQNKGASMKEKQPTAFPQLSEYGMTLRDYFAAKALQGFAADPEMGGEPDLIANLAYEWADAMMKAREE